MTKSQIKKLETLLGKIETLEHQINDRKVKEHLHAGKNELLAALRAAQ